MAVDSLSLTAQETREPLEREVVLLAGDADLLPANAEIHVWIRVVPCSGEAVVNGRVESSFSTECAVCLRPLEASVEEKISGSHRLLPDAGIDLLPDVRDAFMAGIPLRRKCSPECKGLCVKCGKNLNQGPCSCSSEERRSSMKVMLDEALERADSTPSE
jgi:uncharacterized metal-binding protein YceD (DUF177 family)